MVIGTSLAGSAQVGRDVVDGFYIQQAASMVGATPSSLRSWEKYGLVTPRRATSGYRVYTIDDVERLRRVRHLLGEGVNPAGVRRVLEQTDDDPKGHREPNGQSSGRKPRAHRPVGDSLRELRNKHRLSLRDVSERTGLSPSYISSVERSIASPSLASLQKLAKVFETNVLALLGDAQSSPETPVIRHDQRHTIESAPGVMIEDLSTAGSGLEPLVFTIQPGAGSDGPLTHAGEEFLLVLEGEMLLRLDNVIDYHLYAGDSMAFDSMRPHHFTGVGEQPAKVVWINTPRTF